MQINRFDGGVNQRLAPHLLKSSEGVFVKNLNPASGILKPFNQPKSLDELVGKTFTWFKDKWVSCDKLCDFAEHNNMIFKTDGVAHPEYSDDGVNWESLSVETPTKPLQVSPVQKPAVTELEPVMLQISIVDKDLGSQNQFGFNVERAERQTYGGDYSRWGPYQNSGKIFYKVILKHREIDIKTIFSGETTIEKEITWLGDELVPDPDQSSEAGGGSLRIANFRTAFTKLIGNYWFPVANDDLKLYISRDTSDKKAYYRVNLMALKETAPFPGQNSGPYLGSTTTEKFDKGELEEFKSGDVLNYAVIWTNTADNTTYTENISYTLDFQNAICFGMKIKEREGYSVEAYRNGNKCQLLKHGGYFYDCKITKNIEIPQKQITYLYTYYKSKFDIETPPSPETKIATGEKDPTFNVSWELPKDPTIDKIRIYRYGGAQTLPALVGTFPISLTFIGDDLNTRIDGRLLTTLGNIPAPIGIKGIKSIYAMLWAYKGDTLYYTNIGKPFEWSEFNSIKVDEEITGFGATPNGILIFSKTKTYILTGRSPQNFAKFTLSQTIGCIYRHSVQNFNNLLVWIGEGGIYASNGGQITNITQSKFDKFSIKYPQACIVWANYYLVSYASETLAIDLLTNRIFYLSDEVKCFAVKGLELFHCDDNNMLFSTFGSDKPRELEFKSANYAEGSLSNRKTYDNIYFHSTGDLQVKVYVDDKLASETQLNKGVTEVKLNAAHTRGYSLSFDIKGTGSLNEIEYKAEGRQNGR